MKEQIQANLFTKFLAGWCNAEEEAYLKSWLKNNPGNQMFLGFIQQNFQEVLKTVKG